MKMIYISEEYDEPLEEFDQYFECNEIGDYLRFHNAIDKFVWMLRLMYAPKEMIKSKKYKIDKLLQIYINQNIDIEKIKRNIKGKEFSKDKFTYYLKQGWYNELASAYPFNNEQMNLGTYICGDKNSWKSELFPSWFIVKSYYTMYSFYNSLIFTNYDTINTFQHRKPTNHFNNTLINKFSKYILLYPFNINFDGSNDEETFRKIERDEWQYKYSCYPRGRNYGNEKNLFDIEREYFNELINVKTDLKCKSPVNIIDLIYMFRVWANYTGNDTLVKLRKGGLLLFLERNLFAINFFIAAISEITAIAFLGQDNFLENFCEFYNDFILERDEIYQNWYHVPSINRIRIYKHLHLIDRLPENFSPPSRETIEFI